MSLINAEITKIAINTYVTTKISYANTLAELCEQVEGADARVIAEALGKDSRIGSKYLTGALGYGGPCFPRDNIAFSVFAERLGVRADLPRATDAVNRHQLDRLVRMVRENVTEGVVAVLGLAYKPFTPVIEESQGVMIALNLSATLGWRVNVYDPLAMENARRVLEWKVKFMDSVEAAVDGASTVIVTTPDPAFKNLARGIRNAGSVKIIDCWRMLGEDEGLRVVTIGRGPTRS